MVDRDALLSLFGGLCGNCHVRQATMIHEIVPRSKLPGEWDHPDNQIPLCDECNDWVHSGIGTAMAGPLLLVQRKMHLMFYGD